MITAKTNDGFEIELSEDALDDAELLDALGGMQDGNVFDMSHLTLRLLGKEGRKKLYDHLRTPDGRVPVAKVADALGELMNSFTAGKTLHPRRTDRIGRGRPDLRFCPVLPCTGLARPAAASGRHPGRRPAGNKPQPAQGGRPHGGL